MTALDTKLYLQHQVVIQAIKNEILIDEDAATLKCEFAGQPLLILWTYSTGFSVPVFVNDQVVLKHIEQQLKDLTCFQGHDSPQGYAGLVLKP